MQTDEQTGAEIARQMCLAVAYLHSQGVCHRDLSPSTNRRRCFAQRLTEPDNVLMTNGDSPIIKISDFGLAKMVDAQTFLRTACGTPTYLGRHLPSIPTSGRPSWQLQRLCCSQGHPATASPWTPGASASSSTPSYRTPRPSTKTRKRILRNGCGGGRQTWPCSVIWASQQPVRAVKLS
jgi:serine/threonine protein kinase